MAKAPCARFTKFMRPSVTASPDASTKSNMPYATPSKAMVRRCMAVARGLVLALLLRGSLHRVLHGGKGLELDVVELAVLPLDLAQVHVLHHVAGLRVERHGAAWAVPRQTLHSLDECRAIGGAFGRGERGVDEVHAVVAAHRMEVGTDSVVQ